MEKQNSTKNSLKALYIKHNQADNYVDESFLALKKINLEAQIYSYRECVLYSGYVVHQLSANILKPVDRLYTKFVHIFEIFLIFLPRVIVFVLIYVCLRLELIHVNTLLFSFVAPLPLIAYIVQLLTSTSLNLEKLKDDFVNLIKFVSFTYGLSPIINSLTESISSDTIYATTTFMLFLNLLFHDYSSFLNAAMKFSFNAALFACVCLASRFNAKPFHTFTMMLISFILFALWPQYRTYLIRKYEKSILWLTIINGLICFGFLAFLKLWSFLFIYIVSFTIITFILPGLFVKLQVLKNTIYGPWDEAVIR